MPFFKSTYNILKKPDEDEVFDPNWMDSDTLKLPPGGQDDVKNQWDYARPLKIADIDIWEVIYEASGGIGVYAAWKPYANFYMITSGWLSIQSNQSVNERIVEYFYGKNAQNDVLLRAQQLNIPLSLTPVWVSDDDMWLHSDKL